MVVHCWVVTAALLTFIHHAVGALAYPVQLFIHKHRVEHRQGFRGVVLLLLLLMGGGELLLLMLLGLAAALAVSRHHGQEAGIPATTTGWCQISCGLKREKQQ